MKKLALLLAILISASVGMWLNTPQPILSAQEPKLEPRGLPGELIAKRVGPVQVRGYLAATVGSSGDAEISGLYNRAIAAKKIYLPGVEVFLVNTQTGVVSDPVRTDLSGRFTLFAAAKTRYHLCWKSDVYGTDCAKNVVSVGAQPVFLSAVNLTIKRVDGTSAIFGHVTQGDGGPLRMFEPYMGINAFATLDAVDESGNKLGSVYINNFGDYLLPNVPFKSRAVLTASIESTKARQEVWPEARLDSALVHQLNLRMPNTAPRLDPVTATYSGGQRATVFIMGEEVTLRASARDPDGDKPNFVWLLDEGSGKLDRTDGDTVRWILPSERGQHTVSVVAYDGKGGYERQDFSIATSDKEGLFTGTVVDISGSPLSGAEVEVVGNPTVLTDANGAFQLTTALAEKYVFNIRKPGFALVSKIFDRPAAGGRHVLREGQVVTIDPTVDTTISNDKRSERDCPGPESARILRKLEKRAIAEPQWQDGQGNVIDPPGQRIGAKDDGEKKLTLFPDQLKVENCGPGISVSIPADSIVDATGNLVTTPFDVTISTVDLLSPDQMPGDESTLASDGSIKAMESYGAGALDLPTGYQLRPGAAAEITIPVDRSRLSGGSVPAKVPLLSYDEVAGLWKEDGELELQTLAGKLAYVSKVSHFTSFNADTLFTNNACIRVFSPSLPAQYDLEVIAPNPDGSPHYKKVLVPNTAPHEHVIYNLVPNLNLTLAPSTLAPTPQLLGYYVVNAGPQTPFIGSPGPGNIPPASACQNFVVLKTGAFPGTPIGGEFLHGLGFLNAANLGFDDLTNAAPGSGPNTLTAAIADASRNYYSTVNPAGDRSTLAQFKTLWGFDSNPAEIRAAYANSGDLGFGRDMHCLKLTNGNVACYVTNYGSGYNNISPGVGTPDQDDANAAGLQATSGQANEVATVAMEYAPIAGDPKAPGNTNGRIVKFYVYKKGLNNNSLSISANLDGRGERPVPQLCMICHGGVVPQQVGGVPAFTAPAQVSLGSRFIPFDHRFFTFPNNNANLTKAAQENEIKALNEEIVKFAPPASASDPVIELVNSMYANGSSATQLPNPTVPGWATGAGPNISVQQNAYQKVVATACRSCHVTQPFPQLQFNTASKFVELSSSGFPGNRLMLGTVQERVCGDYAMPHAVRTHELFWDPNAWDVPNWGAPVSMNTELQDFGNASAASTWLPNRCTSFIGSNTGTPGTPSNFYQQTLQPLWNGKCVACHIAGSPFAGAAAVPLTDGNSFASLKTAGRVVPGNPPAGSLLNRIEAAAPAARMPPNCFRAPEIDNGNLPCLAQGDIDKIKAWIRSGAN